MAKNHPELRAYIQEARTTDEYSVETILAGVQTFVPTLNNLSEQGAALHKKLQLADGLETDPVLVDHINEGYNDVRSMIRLSTGLQKYTQDVKTILRKHVASLQVLEDLLDGKNQPVQMPMDPGDMRAALVAAGHPVEEQ